MFDSPWVHMCRKAYPLRYSGGTTSALGDRQRPRFPQKQRSKLESGALAHIRRGHCTEVDTPFAGYACKFLSVGSGFCGVYRVMASREELWQ